MEKRYYVYILSSRKNGTLYIGVTSNLIKRLYQHKNKEIKGFTQKYNVIRLIYYEEYMSIRVAIEREKCLKRWKRAWKLKLIEKVNPCWNDVVPGFLPTQE